MLGFELCFYFKNNGNYFEKWKAQNGNSHSKREKFSHFETSEFLVFSLAPQLFYLNL